MTAPIAKKQPIEPEINLFDNEPIDPNLFGPEPEPRDTEATDSDCTSDIPPQFPNVKTARPDRKLSINAWRLIALLKNRKVSEDTKGSLHFITAENFSKIYNFKNASSSMQQGINDIKDTLILFPDGNHKYLINNYGFKNGILTVNIAEGIIYFVRTLYNPIGINATRHFKNAATYILYYKLSDALNAQNLDHTKITLTADDFSNLFSFDSNEYMYNGKFQWANFIRCNIKPAFEEINKDNGTRSGIYINSYQYYQYMHKNVGITFEITRTTRNAEYDKNLPVDKTDFCQLYKERGTEIRKHINNAIAGGADITYLIAKIDTVGIDTFIRSANYAYSTGKNKGTAYKYVCLMNNQTSNEPPDTIYQFGYLTPDLLPVDTYNQWFDTTQNMTVIQKQSLISYVAKQTAKDSPLIMLALKQRRAKLLQSKEFWVLLIEAVRKLAIYNTNFANKLKTIIQNQYIETHEIYAITDILNDPITNDPKTPEKAASVRLLMLHGITNIENLKALTVYSLTRIITNINYVNRYITHCHYDQNTTSEIINAIIQDKADTDLHTTPLFGSIEPTKSEEPEITTDPKIVNINKLRKAFMGFSKSVQKKLVETAKSQAGTDKVYFSGKTEAAMWADIDTARYLVKATQNYVEHIQKSVKVNL